MGKRDEDKQKRTKQKANRIWQEILRLLTTGTWWRCFGCVDDV